MKPLALLAALGLTAQPPPRAIELVDPFIGADGDGNTVPGPKVPFGFANPSPDTVPSMEFRFDTSGYQSDQPIIGFSQTHVSGTGGEGKYGNFRVTPQLGALRLPIEGSGKAEETAAPGYYTVRLTRPGVRVELTATRRAALHRYTFPATGHAHLVIDAGSVIFTGGGDGRRQRPIATRVEIIGDDRIEGTGNFIGGWNPSPYTLHFAARFSRPFAASGTWRGTEALPGNRAASGEQQPAGAFATFDTRRDRVVEMRIGLSFVSREQARANLESEVGVAGFDEIRARAERQWEDALSRLTVSGGTAAERRIFTTALYRSHFMPHDLTGENAAFGVPVGPHYEDYYALWDTYRTLHPLLTLIQPERQRDMVRALIAIGARTGWLPDSRVAGANGMMQGGTNADCLIADAYVKGLDGIDYREAYRLMVRGADEESPRQAYEGREQGDYLSRGWLSLRTERSVSRTAEYAANDFCIAQLARGLGSDADHRRFMGRARNWRHLWDAESRSLRPRNPDGSWLTPYDPTRLYMLEGPRFTWMSAPYYEGSGYQYSTFVPHDVPGLIERLGGDAPFVAWLDAFFGAAPDPLGRTLRTDGLYTQGNEPDLLAPFLYIHAGRPDRTAERVRAIMAREYRTGRRGLPGNDDAGTMSSWYAWNAIGLYPNAGQDLYYIGSPVFTRATIDLGGGKRFVIDAPAASAANAFVASATLNGRRLDRAWLRHAEIARGGRLLLDMRASPTDWGRASRPGADVERSRE